MLQHLNKYWHKCHPPTTNLQYTVTPIHVYSKHQWVKPLLQTSVHTIQVSVEKISNNWG